jgi:glucokinase
VAVSTGLRTDTHPADAELRLVADIGGTNARFALARDGAVLWPTLSRYSTAGYPTLPDALRHYLDSQRAAPTTACLAVAGPVVDGAIAMTNSPWRVQREALAAAFDLRAVSVLNDFAALALALPHLRDAQLAQLGGTAPAGPCRVVLGPGTGFGTATLLDTTAGPVVLPSEAGHAALGAADAEELALFDWLLRDRGDIHGAVYRELLLSGPGLALLHRALNALQGRPDTDHRSAPEITAAALAGDPDCTATLDRFCALLGSAARDLALTLGARGGVYIAGGIVRHFIPFLRRSRFRQRFEASAHMADYLRPIPVYVITESGSGLVGAAVARIEAH